MKIIKLLKLILPLIFFILLLSCTLNHLKYEETITDELARLIRHAELAELPKDAGIIYILDESIVEIYEDGRSRETLHVVFKVLNDRGKEYGDVEIGYNSRSETASIIYARTLTPEGKIIPLNENAIKVATPFSHYPSYSDYKTLSFSMPGVMVDSIIDYKIVIEKKRPEIEGKFSRSFYFQTYEPISFCRYKVITPKDMNLNLNYLVLNPLPGIRVTPEMIYEGPNKVYLWEYENIPQIIRERYMPASDEVGFRILVTTMDSWEEFSSWWRKKIAGKTEANEEIKAKAIDLTQGLSTFREKMEAIFDYVKREIRYVSIDLGKSGYEPEYARKVFSNKYGDCKDKSTLLISMLRGAGVPAHYVLIPTAKIGDLIQDFPYPFQFDHCIVAVKDGDKFHYLDPVAENYRFDYLPGNGRNRGVLIFDNDKLVFDRTPLARPEENASYSKSKIKLGHDGSIKSEVNNSGFGGKDASLRSFFINHRPTKIKESLEERVDEIFSGARLLTYAHSDPMDFRKEFELVIKYEARDYSKKAADILIFDVPEIWKSCPATGKRDRRYPIVIRNNSFYKEEVEFNVPEGYEVYYLPEPMEIKNKYFEFHSSYRQEGEKIFYEGKLTIKAIEITSEDYALYQNYCQSMEKSFNRSVLFSAKKNPSAER